MVTLIIIAVYFALLMVLSRLTSSKATNETFYRANRQSPWYVVAFGMVGASISGVTFVSVPGMVLYSDMTYMQMCLGFIVGYVLVATVLLPVYYRMNLTTIYSYLDSRLGHRSYKTGAWFFLLSKMAGAAARFYVVCLIVSQLVAQPADGAGMRFATFAVTVVAMVLLIWLYTRRGGIKTLVWTDALQTLMMFLALLLIMWQVVQLLGMSVGEAVQTIAADRHSRLFVFEDWVSRQNFWKQFLSGIFVVVVMTGLDQDMMQKNLTCKSLREAQKDMCAYGVAFVPANLLFLSLGVLLTLLAARQGVALPQAGDELLPMFAATGMLGKSVQLLFAIGIVAAAFSSGDSALTSMTTSFCVDICGRKGDERLRKRVHIGMVAVFGTFVLLFGLVGSKSIIDTIYVMCSFTYGPLLGLFAFGLLTKKKTNDRYVPYIAVASPLICFALNWWSSHYTGYQFGYELLMLNGLITFAGIALLRERPCSH